MAQRKNVYSFTSDISPRISIHSIASYLGILIVLIFSALYAIVYLIDGILPVPLTVIDETKHPHSFIAERAQWDLHNLTTIGPRVVGSDENEVTTVDYLTKRIDYILKNAHSNRRLEYDIQAVTGAYYLRASEGVINSYDNVQNIAVKLYGSNSSVSVLVNSHFDSVPTSPGASDDGINVAAMLEILRILSQNGHKPLHNVVFLFNGAEETPLQASHGFITQHKWAKECRVVINLDAAGSGGKIILFQTGPQTPWLVKYYTGVPHPYGQAAGEEIFQSGIIPSDTDFRIFRDHGHLVGLDMAFMKSGYRYHTKYDAFSYIPLGSYQHVGDNTLYLIKALSEAPELSQAVPSVGKSIYFDIFGLFMVSYTNFTGRIVNLATVILSLTTFIYGMFSFKLAFSKSVLQFLGVTTLAILGGWTLSALYVYIFSVILDLLGKTMSWFTHSWLIYGLYVVPTIGLSGCLLPLTNHQNISLNVRCQIQAHTVRLIWTVLLAAGTSFGIRASYAIMIPILFSSLAFNAIHLVGQQHSVKIWQLVYLSFLILPTMNLMYQALITFSMFIPLTGRMGSAKNPELIIGFLALFFTLLISSPITAMTNSIRRVRYYFAGLAAIFTIFVIIVFTPLGFPYSANANNPTPQRQWIMHTSRRFFNNTGDLIKVDAGFFFLNLDRNSPRALREYVPELENAISLKEDCEKYAGCGLPMSHHLMLGVIEYSTWIPAEEPVFPEPVHMEFVKTNLNNEEVQYNLSITGPDRLTVYMIPKNSISLINISLVEKMVQSQTLFQGRPMYFVYYQLGKGQTHFNFTFNVKVPDNWTDPVLDLTVVGRFVHEKEMNKTSQYEKLLQEIPEWADVVAWLGTNYVYSI